MTLFGISLASMLLFGFPFMVTLLGSLILYVYVYMPEFAPKLVTTMVKQVITGVTPPALVCVPMFILSASIITSGESAGRLIRMIKTFVGHLPGGLPITTNASCKASSARCAVDCHSMLKSASGRWSGLNVPSARGMPWSHIIMSC